MIDYCISLFKKKQEEKSYRVYVTEMLRGLAKAHGLDISMTYLDMITPPKQEEEKTADEVIYNIRQKLKKGGAK